MKSAEPGEDWGWCYIDRIQLDLLSDEGETVQRQSTRPSGSPDRLVIPEVTTMAEMLDCLVNFFSEDANAEGMPRRYLSYHIVAGPGPIPEGGVASIMPLAAYDENEICGTCERVFAVKSGGPAAAIEQALLYMDAYHEGDRLRKVQSEIRHIPVRADSAEPEARGNRK
jgi:hypothetical protein